MLANTDERGSYGGGAALRGVRSVTAPSEPGAALFFFQDGEGPIVGVHFEEGSVLFALDTVVNVHTNVKHYTMCLNGALSQVKKEHRSVHGHIDL